MAARRFLAAALIAGAALAALPLPSGAVRADDLPIADAHLHYSHDAWDVISAKDIAELFKKAGIRRALVSSSNDEGTQRLVAAAPGVVWPSLRPYRTRSDASGWAKDEAIVAYLEERLKRHRYVAIGEFHLYGADADLPVPRRMVALARQYNLVLHAHSDAEAVDRLFAQWPEARILWAHAGFDSPDKVRAMLKKHPRLWADLAFRSDHGSNGAVPEAWRAVFLEFPDRFMVGTDTFTPERWFYVAEHAKWSRAWLATLPPAVAEKIAWRNAEALFGHYKP
jgi:hypothetical protein